MSAARKDFVDIVILTVVTVCAIGWYYPESWLALAGLVAAILLAVGAVIFGAAWIKPAIQRRKRLPSNAPRVAKGMKKSPEDDLRDQLREAAKKGDLGAVRKLLDCGVNPHWCDVANRYTLLHYAGDGGNMAVLSEFFRAGLDRYPKE